MEELLAIFCGVDDFCRDYEEYCQHHLLMDKSQIVPKTSMSLSEIMRIVIYVHLSNQTTFKWYYIKFVGTVLRPYFPKQVSYNRFVEIMKMSIAPLTLYLMKYRVGKCTGINFMDSTTLDVCDTHRISFHKVFNGLAQHGKTSMGWFYGFELHLVINDMGEILSVCLTSVNVDDRDWEVIYRLTKELYRKFICRQKICVSFEQNIQLITRLKSNMKNKLVDFSERLLLRKRAVIESVNDFLKNICQIEHSRHRSVDNFFVNLLAVLVAYSFIPKKSSLNIPKLPVSV